MSQRCFFHCFITPIRPSGLLEGTPARPSSRDCNSLNFSDSPNVKIPFYSGQPQVSNETNIGMPPCWEGVKIPNDSTRQTFCEGKKGHQLFSKWSLDLSPQYILMKMVYMGAYKPPVYRHVKCMPIPCGLGQKPCSCLHAALICESIYEKKALNPQKIDTKGFSMDSGSIRCA